MAYYNEYEKNGYHIPFHFTIGKSGIVVTENLSKKSKIGSGDQILSINGNSASQIIIGFRTLINDVRPLYDLYSRLY